MDMEDKFDNDCRTIGIAEMIKDAERRGALDSSTERGVVYLEEYDQMVHFLPEEWGIKVEFNVGDPVRHIRTGREYVVHAVPYCDIRELASKEKEKLTGTDIYNLCYYGNILWVENEHVLDPESGPDGLSADSCYYKNFERMT